MILTLEINKKIIVGLTILLTVAYGLSLATAGVSFPGCAEGQP